ncbi:ParB family protein [Pseudarthrobacter siccitolerans]
MSQNREPIGPPPRRPSTGGVQNLLRANRTPAPESQAPVTPVEAVPSSKKEPVTFYMLSADRQRAKAAYKATNGKEMDASWTEFVARAVMNEVLRRERVYNNGDPFPRVSAKLAPGRKLAP